MTLSSRDIYSASYEVLFRLEKESVMDIWAVMDLIMIGFVIGGLAIGGLVFACVSKQHTLEIQRLERMLAKEKQKRRDICDGLNAKINVVDYSVQAMHKELNELNSSKKK